VAWGVSDPILNYRDSLKADKSSYVRFTAALMEHGVRALERGAWFLSLAHTDDIIDQTLDTISEVARQIQKV